MRWTWRMVAAAAMLTTTACGSPAHSGATSSQVATSQVQAVAAGPGHVVIVVMENHSYGDIIGSSQAPYINSLGRQGKSLTQMFAITHPSQPNYLGLFSGSTQGITSDSCPHTFTGNNLGRELRSAGRTFAGYSEGLPKTGSTVCTSGGYARKHAPWVNFSDLPGSVNKPYTSFPTSYSTLPTVSFVIPNLNHDMHDGTVRQGDTWLQQHLAGYAKWAVKNRSLLVVTWDEDDRSASNHIPTVIVGAGVAPGRIDAHLTLYGLLRTVEDRYGLHRLGASTTARAIPLS